jgi:hypothetical protein
MVFNATFNNMQRHLWAKGFKHDCQNRLSLPIPNGCRGYDGMVVEFTITYAISTEVVSSNTAHGEVYCNP